MTAAHYLFIPAVLLGGIVLGWILGSHMARDAYAAELRRRDERERPRPARGAGGERGGAAPPSASRAGVGPASSEKG